MENKSGFSFPSCFSQSEAKFSMPFSDEFHEQTMQPLHLSCSSNKSNRLPLPFFGFALVLLLSFASPTSSCSELEKSSLLDLLAGLSSSGGLNVSWWNGMDCCTWEGIACSSDGTVTHVSLASKGLEGRISPSLGNLTGLLHLNLSHNSLSGGLPVELVFSSSVLDVSFNRLTGAVQELPSSTPGRPLQVLNISSNLFTGQFPSTTWEVTKNLVALNASNNSFTGLIPTSFCISAPSFTILDLSYNQFSGKIPQGLGNCSMLKMLKAGTNKVDGSLPDEIFSATSLECLSFPNNGLQGTLDGSHITKLTSLTILDLGGNELSGSIPDSIGELKRLEELHLDHNRMSGKLPPTLGNSTNLKYINLGSNSFNGELGKVNFTLCNLKIVDLSMNSFRGTIPESIYSCSSLAALRLAFNNFHGQLSPRISELKSLSFLSLTNNYFTNITNTLQILKSSKNLYSLIMGSNFKGETMPEGETIDGFENLQVLTIESCALLGQIPLWLSKLTKLKLLDLSSNQLTGPIPPWINILHLLFFLDVSNNSLTGGIPTALMEMPAMLQSERDAAQSEPRILDLPVYRTPSLQYRGLSALPQVLNLGNNNFTGVIPPDIGRLKVLSVLNFSFNNLFGDIPQQICDLKSLLVLDLSNNHLTGAIPSALNNLNFLSQLNVSNNELEGPIPTGAQFDTFLNSSYNGNPKLCGAMLNHHCDSTSGDGNSYVASSSWRHNLCLALIVGFSFGGLIALALVGCYLLARLVYDDHIKTRFCQLNHH